MLVMILFKNIHSLFIACKIPSTVIAVISKLIHESVGFVQIFDFWFLMDLHVLGCPEHDFTISGKCLRVCDKKFVASVAQELMHKI